MAGVSAGQVGTGDTVTFPVYLTSAAATDTVLDWTVIAPDAGDLGAAAFGGALPSGQVTIPAGQTSGQFTVQVPSGALGDFPARRSQFRSLRQTIKYSPQRLKQRSLTAAPSRGRLRSLNWCFSPMAPGR